MLTVKFVSNEVSMIIESPEALIVAPKEPPEVPHWHIVLNGGQNTYYLADPTKEAPEGGKPVDYFYHTAYVMNEAGQTIETVRPS